MVVIVEARGPGALVVTEDDGVGLRDDITDSGRGVGLRVGAVADDLVGGPLARRRPPLPGLLGHLGEGLPEPGGSLGVPPDQLVPFREIHARPSRARFSWPRWLSSWAAMSATQSSKVTRPR